MSLRSKIAWAAGTVFIAVPVFLTLYVNSQDTREWISDYVSDKTGREVIIQRTGISWGLEPEIFLEGVKVGNTPWAVDKHALEATRVTASIAVKSLLRGVISISRIEITGGNLWVQNHPVTGRTNLNFGGVDSEKSHSHWLVPEIQEIEVTGSTVIYRQAERDWLVAVEGMSISSSSQRNNSRITALGRLEGTPVQFTGTTGSLGDIAAHREIPVEVEGFLGKPQNSFSISGVIQDLIRWHGLNLWFESKIDNLADLSAIAGRALPQFRDINGRWELVQPDFTGSMALESVELHSSGYGLDTQVQGEIQKLIGMRGITMEIASSGTLSDQRLSAFLGTDTGLMLDFQGTLTGDRNNLRLESDVFEISGTGFNFEITEPVGINTDDSRATAPFLLQVDSLEMFNEIDAGKYGAFLPIAANGVVEYAEGAINLKDIAVTGQSSEFEVVGNGYMDRVGLNSNGELKFSVNAGTLGIEAIAGPTASMLLENLTLGLELKAADGMYSLENVRVTGAGEGVELAATGRVGHLLALQDIDINTSGTMDSLQRLQLLTAVPVPPTDSIKFTAQVMDKPGGNIVLRIIEASLDDPGFSASATGYIDLAGDERQASIQIESEQKNIDIITALFPDIPGLAELSGFFPVESRIQVRGSPDEQEQLVYSITDLSLNSRSADYTVSATGEISNLFTDSMMGRVGFSLQGKIDQSLVSALGSGILPRFIPSELVSGNISGSGEFAFQSGDAGLENLQLELLHPHTRIAISGALNGFNPPDFSDLKLEIDSDQLSRVTVLESDSVNMSNPVSARIALDRGAKVLNVGLDISIGASSINGLLHIDREKNPDNATVVTASLHAPLMDLNDLLKKAEPSKNLFSDSPLDMNWLDYVKFDLDVHADIYRGRTLNLNNLRVTANGDKDGFSLDAIGESRKGNLAIGVGLDRTANQQIDGRLSANGVGVDMSALVNAVEQDKENVGEFSIRMDINGQGSSIAGMASNAVGEILFELSGARMESQGLRLVSQDLFHTMISTIIPQTSREDLVDVECGVVNFMVDNGVAMSRSGLAVKLPDFTLLGGGSIDLESEKIDVVISSKARKGLGINPNTLAKMFSMGGTIKDPEVTTDMSGFLQTGVAVGAALVSGGLSLVAQGLRDRRIANADVCQLAKEDKGAYPIIEERREPEK